MFVFLAETLPLAITLVALVIIAIGLLIFAVVSKLFNELNELEETINRHSNRLTNLESNLVKDQETVEG